MIRKAFLAALLLGAPSAARAADSPAAAANAFYAVYGPTHLMGGGVPDATQRVRYAPVLSPALNARITQAAAAQARLTAKVKNAVPPVLQGDIFTSLFEGATAWTVGTCTGDARLSRCRVTLTHVPATPPDSKAAGGKVEKPVQWDDILVLVSTPQGWKLDDVLYDARFAFGNTGRLSAMLEMVVATNP
ncbi:MAG TPA: hypothetical protein VFQ69_04705 [Rhizomicrobium sp.]|nr:hypothetical protein [Rhizomicrobium sp.]